MTGLMLDRHPQAGPGAARIASPTAAAWTLFLPLSLLWLSLFAILSIDWSINAQYSYGWAVPFLALAVLWQRWTSRPAAQAAHERSLFAVAAIVLLLALLPLRAVQQANPEWRLALWTHAAIAALISLLVAGYSGGRPWIRHFAFPALFPLISVPLPVRLEQSTIQFLTSIATGAATELAFWSGIPADRHGNLIEIGSGLLGVEEACSGIRSFQSSLLVAIFLGEHFLCSPARRLALLALSILISVLVNIGRTSLLVFAAAREGIAAADRLHDSAAGGAMIAALASIFFLAYWLKPKTSAPARAAATSVVRPVPAWFSLAAASWLLLAALSVEVWFRLHERNQISNPRWSVIETSGQTGLQAVDIPERSRSMLRYSDGRCMTWRDSSGFHWRLYYFRWEPGRNSAQLAKGHTPDICLSGAGGQIESINQAFSVETASVRLPFEHYLFDFAGKPLNVFYCLWEDRPREADSDMADGTKLSRLAATLSGRRNLGQSVLEIAVQGPSSPEEARAALRRELPRLIRNPN